jgi:hypothetical protein
LVTKPVSADAALAPDITILSRALRSTSAAAPRIAAYSSPVDENAETASNPGAVAPGPPGSVNSGPVMEWTPAQIPWVGLPG